MLPHRNLGDIIRSAWFHRKETWLAFGHHNRRISLLAGRPEHDREGFVLVWDEFLTL